MVYVYTYCLKGNNTGEANIHIVVSPAVRTGRYNDAHIVAHVLNPEV